MRLLHLEVVKIRSILFILAPSVDLLQSLTQEESTLGQPAKNNQNDAFARKMDGCGRDNELKVPHCQDNGTAEGHQNKTLPAKCLKSGPQVLLRNEHGGQVDTLVTLDSDAKEDAQEGGDIHELVYLFVDARRTQHFSFRFHTGLRESVHEDFFLRCNHCSWLWHRHGHLNDWFLSRNCFKDWCNCASLRLDQCLVDHG